MVWIETIEHKDAQGKLKQMYEDLIEKRGKISNILKIQSLLPETMKTHLDLYLSIMFNTSQLKREEKELIAVIVSMENQCQYCINHHAEALLHYWKNQSKISKIIHEKDYSFLNEKHQVIIDHAIKLTQSPHLINEKDIVILKDQGYSDGEILEITLIVAYFNFVNRIALGLDIPFSEEEIKGYKY